MSNSVHSQAASAVQTKQNINENNYNVNINIVFLDKVEHIGLYHRSKPLKYTIMLLTNVANFSMSLSAGWSV